jgi:hypothetical protein
MPLEGIGQREIDRFDLTGPLLTHAALVPWGVGIVIRKYL